MAVALGNVRGGQAALFPRHLLTLARTRDPVAALIHHPDQADSIANWANTHLFPAYRNRHGGRAVQVRCPNVEKQRAGG